MIVALNERNQLVEVLDASREKQEAVVREIVLKEGKIDYTAQTVKENVPLNSLKDVSASLSAQAAINYHLQ